MKTRMNNTERATIPHTVTTRVQLLCLLAVPILLALADVLRMRAEGNSAVSGGVGNAPDMVALFEFLALHRTDMVAATLLTFLTAFVAMFAVALLWKLGSKHAPLFSKAVLVVGTFFVMGRVIHTIVYFGTMLYFSASYPPAQAAELNDSMGSFWVVNMVIVPTIIGLALWLPLAGIMLWRVRVIPLWAGLAVVVGTLVLVILGSSFATTILMAALTVAGFAPVLWQRVDKGSSVRTLSSMKTGETAA